VNGFCAAGQSQLGGPCDETADCATGVCCTKVCVDPASFQTDPGNCGSCGNACPGQSTECATIVCVTGNCTSQWTPFGTALAIQTSGDCRTAVCDGKGGATFVPDDTDAPASGGTGCTTAICVEGAPQPQSKPSRATCADNGGTLCDGAGNCVECLAPSDCASNVCLADHTCCVVLPVAEFCGTQCGTVVGTCQTEDCGACCLEPDDPCTDNDECCSGVCVDGFCAGGPVRNDDPCDEDEDCASGACCGSVCVDPAVFDDDPQNCGSCGNICSGLTTECEWPICVAGGCGTGYAGEGTPLADQTAGDCLTDVCDGAGGFTTILDDFDVPADDGSGCLQPACLEGSPTTQPRSAGAPCETGVCDGDGTCVECIDGSTCASEVCLENYICCVVLPLEEFCAGQCGTVTGDCQTEECPCACADGYEIGSDGVTCVPTEETCNIPINRGDLVMSNADFRECNFAGYEITRRFLNGVDFTGANLTNAILRNSNFSGANFTNAILTGVIWNQAVCPDDTVLPDVAGVTCCDHLNGKVPAAC
jgi:hypothetical protein